MKETFWHLIYVYLIGVPVKITKIDHMYDTRSRETIGVLVYPKIFQGTICITDLWYLWILNGYPRYFVISRMYRAPRSITDISRPWYSWVTRRSMIFRDTPFSPTHSVSMCLLQRSPLWLQWDLWIKERLHVLMRVWLKYLGQDFQLYLLFSIRYFAFFIPTYCNSLNLL